MADLEWLGLDWDEGPRLGGDHGPYVQSERSRKYQEALDSLAGSGSLYPCGLSRSQIADVASAPHGSTAPFPQTLRARNIASDWWDRHRQSDGAHAIRFKVQDETVSFTDLVHGRCTDHVSSTCGDFVVRRRDGVMAYQLAVVVDDIAMSVTHVVRGDDIRASTGRQILLYKALGATPPAFAHVPLVLDCKREKLSKRHESLRLAALRENGVEPQQIIGYLAYSCGLTESPRRHVIADLVANFNWSRISHDPWVLPDESRLISGLLDL